MNRRWFSIATLAIALCVLLPDCAYADTRAPLKVLTSFSILADMVREVAGRDAVVQSIVGPDADAHVYEPSPADVARIAAADVVIVNGLHFEGWLDRLVRASGYRGRIVVATRGISPRLLEGVPDPHAWQSLVLVDRYYVENIRVALVAAMPDRAAAVNARAVAYRARLRALDRRIRARLGAIPQARRVVITSHDAFGYFADAYRIRFISPQGWSTEQEASAETVARVVRQIRRHGVRALFVENISDRRLIEQVARDGGVRIGGKLYSDALSARGGPAETYLDLVDHNANGVIVALGLSGH